MPLFHKRPPSAKSRSATARSGFSMNLSTRRTPGQPGTGSAGAIQPNPVSGRDGAMPKVTSQPSVAASTAGRKAASKAGTSCIR